MARPQQPGTFAGAARREPRASWPDSFLDVDEQQP
jgi:hypothetical protein